MQSKEETVKNLINCGTCGYPLTPEERTTLVEKDGVMVKPAPAQEPALVIYQGEIAKSNLPKGFTGMLYTTPPAAQRRWVGLTPEEIDAVYRDMPPPVQHWQLARALEAKLKEKNT